MEGFLGFLMAVFLGVAIGLTASTSSLTALQYQYGAQLCSPYDGVKKVEYGYFNTINATCANGVVVSSDLTRDEVKRFGN